MPALLSMQLCALELLLIAELCGRRSRSGRSFQKPCLPFAAVRSHCGCCTHGAPAAAMSSSVASSAPLSSCGTASRMTLASAPARLHERRCCLPRTRFQTPEGKQMTAAQLKPQGGDLVLRPDGRLVSVSRSTLLLVQEQPVARGDDYFDAS